MGLDMYLFKSGVVNHHNMWEHEPDGLKATNPELYEAAKEYEVTAGNPDFFTWQSYKEGLGYWRKANAIHKWFVDNVQNGVDDCGMYPVTREHLSALKAVCEKAMAFFNKDGELLPDAEAMLEDILPTQSGFFFGGIAYDEWYYRDLADTIETIDKILNDRNINWNKDVLLYHSSW